MLKMRQIIFNYFNMVKFKTKCCPITAATYTPGLLLTKVEHWHKIVCMKQEKLQFEFSADKNQLLIKERSISFESIIAALSEGHILDVLEHPNKIKYPNQKIYVVEMDGYAWLVPFVRKDNETIFLKTAFPSRKLTTKYLGTGG